MALTEVASLSHSFRKISWKSPHFVSLQVKDIFCSLHCSHACQPLTDLKERRTHERQDALEVKYRVIDVGSVALPGAQ